MSTVTSSEKTQKFVAVHKSNAKWLAWSQSQEKLICINHSNMSRLQNNYTSRVRQDESEQFDLRYVTSPATSNASTNNPVSDEYAVIDEDRSTSTAAAHSHTTSTTPTALEK